MNRIVEVSVSTVLPRKFKDPKKLLQRKKRLTRIILILMIMNKLNQLFIKSINLLQKFILFLVFYKIMYW